MEMFKSCSVTINPAFVPCSPRTYEMVFTDLSFPASLLVGSQMHMKERKQRRVETEDRNE